MFEDSYRSKLLKSNNRPAGRNQCPTFARVWTARPCLVFTSEHQVESVVEGIYQRFSTFPVADHGKGQKFLYRL